MKFNRSSLLLYVCKIPMRFTGTVLSSQKEITRGLFSYTHAVNTSASCDLNELKMKLMRICGEGSYHLASYVNLTLFEI